MSRLGDLLVGMTIQHEGHTWQFADAPAEAILQGQFFKYEKRANLTPGSRENLLQQRRLSVEHEGWSRLAVQATPEALEHGTLLMDDEPLPEGKAHLLRSTLLATYRDLPPLGALDRDLSQATERQDVIPGAWARGDIPLLSGPPKIGKSSLLIDLAATLLTPGRRFLGHFPPARFTAEEETADELRVVYINAENPVDSMHRSLLAQGLKYDEYSGNAPFYYSGEDDNRLLTLVHLEEYGDPEVFDLTVPERFDEWAYRLAFCPCPDPEAVRPPTVVILDGITAIVGLERAELLYARFRALMRSLDVPIALAAGHAGLGQKHAYGATAPSARPDSLWSYWTRDRDVSPGSKRMLSITPRLDGPEVDDEPVVRGEGGSLALRPKAAKEEHAGTGRPAPTPIDAPPGESPDQYEHEVIDRLAAAGSIGLRKTEMTGTGRIGALRRAAAERLLAVGQVTFTVDGQGQRWRLPDAS